MPRVSIVLLSLSTASTIAAVQVDAMSTLASLTAVLDDLYLPLETTATTIKTFVAGGTIASPTPAEAGMVSGTDKGALATALYVSYEDVGTNGLWIAYNDSSILGYWNINGVGDRHTQIMYREAGNSTCPTITTTAACSPDNLADQIRPASCDAVVDDCQTFHNVNGRGDPLDIARQRWYDPKVRGWWKAAANYPLGQPYWIDLFGTTGYHSTDSTLPLLIGYYAVPIVDTAGLQAIVLIQMWYTTIAKALASFNHMTNTVVYVMEASTGELVAASNGENIFTDTGGQKMAANAATELIATSAQRIASFRATAIGMYSDPSNRISTTVVDYQRASGTMHHKIVLASYVSATPGTVIVPAAAPVIVPAPAPAPVASPASAPVVAPATSDSGAAVVAITCTALVVILVLVLAIFALKTSAVGPARARTGLAGHDSQIAEVEKA